MRFQQVFSRRSRWAEVKLLLVATLVLTLTPSARADTWLSVDCSGGTGDFDSIQAAVDALLPPPPGEWNNIHVLSDCTENVTISGQQRLWLGSPLWWGEFPKVTITGVQDGEGTPVGPVITISNSREIVLSKLILTGGQVGLWLKIGSVVQGDNVQASGNENVGIRIEGNSSLLIDDGGAVGNGGDGIIVSESTLSLLGRTPWFPEPEPFVVSGNGGSGIFAHRGVVNIGGGVLVSENGGEWIWGYPGAGIVGHGSNLIIGSWTGDENVIRENVKGVLLREQSQLSIWGFYTIRNNATTGVEITQGSQAVFWACPPCTGPAGVVTIEENPVAGVLVNTHSQAGFVGANRVRNNGSPAEPLRAGLRVDGTSQVLLEGGNEVTGNVGPGIAVDIGSSVDILDAVITGNTEEAVRLQHMSIAEIAGATDTMGNGGGALTCDTTSLAITTLSLKGVKCANLEGATGGGKPPKAASVAPDTRQIEAVMQQARSLSERFKKPR